MAVRPEIGKAIVEVVRDDHAAWRADAIELGALAWRELYVAGTKKLA